MTRSAPLAVLLLLQACLLFSALDLLPMWSDELFTVQAVAHPVREIIPIVQRDIHPPLYYVLLRGWASLPLPWTGVPALRAFSCLWALLATLLLDLFWTRTWKPFARWLALMLFALSPCLLLYGRMARSYSMQVALAMLALGLIERWMGARGSAVLACGACAAMLALLYTHYVPGLAVLAGFALVAWRGLGVVRTAAAVAIVVAGYVPWMITLSGALRKWGASAGFSSNYSLSGNPIFEQIIKAGFGIVSLTIGESFFGVWLLLVPVVILVAVLGTCSAEFERRFATMLGIAAAVGYLGVSRWVSYPFIPARMLWLLPFVCIAVALGISQIARTRLRMGVALIILVSYVSSDMLYFRQEGFLNPGYAAPLREIAVALNREAQPADLILADGYNTDSQVIGTELSGRTPYIVLDAGNVAEARRRMQAAATIWIVRNTRDTSPGHITTIMQSEACSGRLERDDLLEPYALWQQAAMQMVGIRPALTHFYQLTRCSTRR